MCGDQNLFHLVFTPSVLFPFGYVPNLYVHTIASKLGCVNRLCNLSLQQVQNHGFVQVSHRTANVYYPHLQHEPTQDNSFTISGKFTKSRKYSDCQTLTVPVYFGF